MADGVLAGPGGHQPVGDGVLRLVLGILGVWRITHLLQAEDGPWDVIVRLRRAAGDGFWGSLLDCFYCLSLWIAARFAAWLGGSAGECVCCGRRSPARRFFWSASQRHRRHTGRRTIPVSCCGKKRTDLRAAGGSRPAPRAGEPPRTHGAAAGASLGSDFEYLGGSVLAVIGQGTGRQYRFVGHGARLSVDQRDRASLSAVPSLRPVLSGR